MSEYFTKGEKCEACGADAKGRAVGYLWCGNGAYDTQGEKSCLDILIEKEKK